jgi:hypothetical protein
MLGTPNSCYSLKILTLSYTANPLPKDVPDALQCLGGAWLECR